MINVPEGPGTKRRDVRKGRESPEAWPGGGLGWKPCLGGSSGMAPALRGGAGAGSLRKNLLLHFFTDSGPKLEEAPPLKPLFPPPPCRQAAGWKPQCLPHLLPGVSLTPSHQGDLGAGGRQRPRGRCQPKRPWGCQPSALLLARPPRAAFRTLPSAA